jgi:hypothetical protein
MEPGMKLWLLPALDISWTIRLCLSEHAIAVCWSIVWTSVSLAFWYNADTWDYVVIWFGTLGWLCGYYMPGRGWYIVLCTSSYGSASSVSELLLSSYFRDGDVLTVLCKQSCLGTGCNNIHL